MNTHIPTLSEEQNQVIESIISEIREGRQSPYPSIERSIYNNDRHIYASINLLAKYLSQTIELYKCTPDEICKLNSYTNNGTGVTDWQIVDFFTEKQLQGAILRLENNYIITKYGLRLDLRQEGFEVLKEERREFLLNKDSI